MKLIINLDSEYIYGGVFHYSMDNNIDYIREVINIKIKNRIEQVIKENTPYGIDNCKVSITMRKLPWYRYDARLMGIFSMYFQPNGKYKFKEKEYTLEQFIDYFWQLDPFDVKLMINIAVYDSVEDIGKLDEELSNSLHYSENKVIELHM